MKMIPIRYKAYSANFLAFFVFLFPFLLGLISYAEARDVGNKANQQILSIARTVQAEGRQTELLMESLGYPPKDWQTEEQKWRNFDKWPLERKIETAWLSAEEVNSGEGDRFLKALSRRLAEKNQAIRNEPALRDFFPELPKKPLIRKYEKTFSFVAPWDIPAEKRAVGAPLRVQKLLKAIAKHSMSYPGGTKDLIRRCCDIPENKAYDMVRKGRSIEEVLLNAIETGELPPEKIERIKKLLKEGLHFDAAIAAEIENPKLRDAMRGYVSKGSTFTPMLDLEVEIFVSSPEDAIVHAMETSRTLTTVLENIPNTATSAFNTMRLSLEGGAKVAEIGAHKIPPSVARAAYKNFQIFNYGLPTSSGNVASSNYKFRSIIRSSRGFGGIVFGNQVSSKQGVMKPLAFTWHSIASDKGVLIFVFEDGSRAYSPPMFAADTLTAINIVYGIPGVMAPLDKGEGLGLVGYTGRFNAYEISEGKVKQRNVIAETFLVHPTLSSELGKAAIMVDAMPFLMKEYLKYRTQQHDIPAKLRAGFKAWLETEWSTYKFIDVPLEIKIDNNRFIHAVRSDYVKGISNQSLRDFAFITNVTFRQDGSKIPDSDEIFYPLVPQLTALSHHFAWINDFAQVFALIRWAKSVGAEVINRPKAPENNSDWSTIIIDEKGSIELGPNKYQRARAFAVEVEKKAQDILATNEKFSVLRQISADILENRIERISLDFLLESANKRFIASTHLGSEKSNSLAEQAILRGRQIVKQQLKELKLLENMIAAINRGEISAVKLINEMADTLAVEMFDTELNIAAATNPDFKNDLVRYDTLRKRLLELENVYFFKENATEFLRTLVKYLEDKRNKLNKLKAKHKAKHEKLSREIATGNFCIHLLYKFASKDVKEKFAVAYTSYKTTNIGFIRKYYESTLLSNLPELNIKAINTEIAVIDHKISELNSQLTHLPVSDFINDDNFASWYRLQKSYADQCKSGACF